MAPSWDPERVLDVYPQVDGFHCVGTTLQGLRCRQSFISREYRRRATAKLDVLPELTQCRIGHVALLADLYDIAWYTLCPRWHQTKKPQADIISQRWLQTILDLENITRGERRTPSTSSGSTTSRSASSSSSSYTYGSSSSSGSSSDRPSRDNSSNRSSNSTHTLAFSLGSHSSRSNTLRGSSSSSGSQSNNPSIGPLYPASRESSVRPPSVTNSSSSRNSGANSSSSSRNVGANTQASNAPGTSAISPLAQTRQHWSNLSVLPTIATQATNSDRGFHRPRLVEPIIPEERNTSQRSDAPSPSSPSVSSSIVTSNFSPTTAPRTRRATIFSTSAPPRYDEYQLPTPVRTPDVVQDTVGATSQRSRTSTSTSSSRISTTRGSNHVIHLNLNLNVTVAGGRDRTSSGIETPTPSARHSRSPNSPSYSVSRSDEGSSSSSPSVVSTAESISELLAALEEVVARFNSRSVASSPSTLGRRPHGSTHTPRSRTLSPEPPLPPNRVRSTSFTPESASEVPAEIQFIIYTPTSSGSSTPVLVSTPQSFGSESPVFVSPQPSPSTRIITGPPGIVPEWYISPR